MKQQYPSEFTEARAATMSINRSTQNTLNTKSILFMHYFQAVPASQMRGFLSFYVFVN